MWSTQCCIKIVCIILFFHPVTVEISIIVLEWKQMYLADISNELMSSISLVSLFNTNTFSAYVTHA